MSSKIEDAAKATTLIQHRTNEALGILNRRFTGRILNGDGVYHDPSGRAADLYTAQKLLTEALQIMTSTHWPRESDYETDDEN